MNERLKEFAAQYFDVRNGIVVSPVDGYCSIEEELQEYAKLIIRDTLDVARAGIEFGPSMDEAVYTYFGLGNET